MYYIIVKVNSRYELIYIPIISLSPYSRLRKILIELKKKININVVCNVLYLRLHSIRTSEHLKIVYPRSLTVFMIVKYLFGIKTRQRPILGARGYHFRGTLFDQKYIIIRMIQAERKARWPHV